VTTVVGTGAQLSTTSTAVSGKALASPINYPKGIFLRGSKLYIAESSGHRVSMVDLNTGDYTPIAGTGSIGSQNGPVSSAKFNYPYDVALDAAGNIYVADYKNNRIRKIDTLGDVTTFAGTGQAPTPGNAVEWLPNDILATSAKILNPSALRFDSAGNLYFANGANTICKIDTNGKIWTIAGNGNHGKPTNGANATSVPLGTANGIALHPTTNEIYFTDSFNHRIYKLGNDNKIWEVAGTGISSDNGDGPALATNLYSPCRAEFDAAGNLVFSTSGKIRKWIAADNRIVTLAGSGTMDSDSRPPATAARLHDPIDVAVTADKTLLISDSMNHRVVYVEPVNGRIKAGAGTEIQGYKQDDLARKSNFNQPAGLAVRPGTSMLYVADTQNHLLRVVDIGYAFFMNPYYGAGNRTPGFSGDNGYAKSAQLNNPTNVAVNAAGDFYIADTDNHRVRKVALNTMTLSAVAGTGTAAYAGDGTAATGAALSSPRGVAVDSKGNLYIADTGNHVVRKVDNTTGFISTFAGTGTPDYSGDGGQAKDAELNGPWDVAVDRFDNVYIADTGNHTVRRVDPFGTIITLAGDGTLGFGGDGGSARTAQLNGPTGITVDSDGGVYIADRGNQRVRKVVQQTIAQASADGANVLVNTFGVPNASLARVTLEDSNGNPVTGAEGSFAIANQAATVPFEIPVTVPAGTYKILVQVNGIAEAKRIPWIVPVSTDARLRDLKVNGATVSGFDPAKEQYQVVLPYGTTAVPTVSGTVFATGKANEAVTPASDLQGKTTIVVTAEDGTTKKTYEVSYSVALNPAKAITGFAFQGLNPVVTGTIDETAKTIALTVPSGTDVTQLVPTIVHTGVSISPNNGLVQNFSNPVLYAVTAEDGGMASYTVSVSVGRSNDATLKDLTVNGTTVSGFDPAKEQYQVVLPYGTTEVPTVSGTVFATGKANAAVTPAASLPGTATVVVTAEDGMTKKTYEVSFSIASNTAKAITGFTFRDLNPVVTGTIDETAKTISVTVPWGTDVTQLIPTITHNGVSIAPDSGRIRDFSLPVVYTATAQDGSTASYVVTVSAGLSNNAKLGMLGLSNAALSPAYSPDHPHYVASVTNAVYYTNVIAVAQDSKAAIVMKSGGRAIANPVQLNVGINVVEVIVTSEDGLTTKTYTIVITREAPVVPPSGGGGGGSSSEEIMVDVETGNSGNAVSKTKVVRETASDGSKKDRVTLQPAAVEEAIAKAKELGSNAIRVVIPDVRDEVSEVKVDISKAALQLLKDAKADLELSTGNMKIIIPGSSLGAFNEDLYFRFVPIKEQTKRQEVEERAKKEEMIKQIAKDAQIEIWGRPMVVETNMENRPVILQMPLGTLPADVTKRQELLNNLVIFIEHDDGTKELVKGEASDYSQGSQGLKFRTNKFSTFTMVYMPGWKEYIAQQEQGQGKDNGQHKAYIKGFKDGTFRPEASVSRAEMAAMLGRNMQGTGAKALTFKDLPNSHWASQEISATSENGIFLGFEDNTFRPQEVVTRAQMAAIVSRWLTNVCETDAKANAACGKLAGAASFQDVSAKHWAADEIRAAAASGIMTGGANGTFRPEEALTRAEAVKVLNRLFGRGPLHGELKPTFSDMPSTNWAFREVEEAARDHGWTKEGGKETIGTDKR
jgi:sugar lactone lactonase YvrE